MRNTAVARPVWGHLYRMAGVLVLLASAYLFLEGFSFYFGLSVMATSLGFLVLANVA
jgi:hypothetical protein